MASEAYPTNWPLLVGEGQTYPGGDITGVFVNDETPIPKVPDSAVGSIFYLEANLMGKPECGKHNMFHSGIGFTFPKGTDYGPLEMCVQLYAEMPLTQALLPNPSTGKWENSIVIGMTPKIDRSYWFRSHEVGEISGLHFKELFGTLIKKYARENNYYQPYTVEWKEQEVVRDRICDSFSKTVLQALVDLCEKDGACTLNIAEVRNNKVVLTAADAHKPVKVDLTDPTQKAEVDTYFAEMAKLAPKMAEMQAKGIHSAEAIGALGSVDTKAERIIFVGCTGLGFTKVVLKSMQADLMHMAGFFSGAGVYLPMNIRRRSSKAVKHTDIAPAEDGTVEMKVTNKKPPSFYKNAACSFLKGVEAKPASEGKEAVLAKPAVEQLRISGLGEAVAVATAAATNAEESGAGKIVKIQTTSLIMEGSGRGCPQIVIDLKKI